MNREQKKLETRSRLTAAAFELFAEQGFDATTVVQITERAGVAKGTFFNYFENKADVLCDHHMDWAYSEIVRVIGKPGPLMPRLRALLQVIAERIYFSKPITRASFQNWFGPGKAATVFTEHNRHLASAIEAVIDEGQQRGDLTTKYPARMLADLAMQTFYGVLVLWASSDDEDEGLVERLAVAFDLFFRGIESEPGESRGSR